MDILPQLHASLTTLNIVLLIGAGLVATGLVAGLFTSQRGFSHLLVFLLVGMLAGVDGPLGLKFEAHSVAFGIGNLALATILLDGGLRTPVSALRIAAMPAGLLATLGVFISCAVIAGFAAWGFGMDWRFGALMGATVASTDAAAVFNLLSSSKLKLPPRVSATIEVESGLNDPMAVFLTLSLLSLLAVPALPLAELGKALALQVGVGVAMAGACGWLGAALLSRLPLRADDHGLTALLLAATGVLVFAGAAQLEGSGFLAVYLYGVELQRRVPERVRPALAGIDGFTWLGQAVMFLLLGLLVTPHEVWRFMGVALPVALVLMFVARPLAVFVCLTPLRFSWREMSLISAVGLRGAVPIVLALYPVLQGLPQAYVLFDVAFVIVLSSLLLQAPSLKRLANWLMPEALVADPDAPWTPAPRTATSRLALAEEAARMRDA